MRFASLGSGSRGNATVVEAGSTRVLIDCGFSARETERRLERLGLTASELDAVLVTHEHGDHCAGVATLSRRHSLPVFMTRGTLASGRCDGVWRVEHFHSKAAFEIGELRIEPLAVPHDAREPCQFVLQSDGQRLGILTDLGSITAAVMDHYQGCDGLLLECNHDVELLQLGPYPPALKRRVGGDWGHLNNMQAADLLRQVHGAHLRHLVVAHVSEQNNLRDRVLDALGTVLGDAEDITWADQQRGFSWLNLARS
jgi:phosphoribosyl 1,2-cyclic phosphodiesterase